MSPSDVRRRRLKLTREGVSRVQFSAHSHGPGTPPSRGSVLRPVLHWPPVWAVLSLHTRCPLLPSAPGPHVAPGQPLLCLSWVGDGPSAAAPGGARAPGTDPHTYGSWSGSAAASKAFPSSTYRLFPEPSPDSGQLMTPAQRSRPTAASAGHGW
uniref:Uncharacterized protein n=1 Tax=Molossus molossus TaxID=27622 RepID=A0A7J8BLV5_MOLMO|nr:hypothetical protein HJG59_010104 [Molossus molossus]